MQPPFGSHGSPLPPQGGSKIVRSETRLRAQPLKGASRIAQRSPQGKPRLAQPFKEAARGCSWLMQAYSSLELAGACTEALAEGAVKGGIVPKAAVGGGAVHIRALTD